ncbi:unnamed protein product [Cylicostephanus goldi]|uniref:Uncharacterized protein n=1 Tax=Cylicostephanus goldi TaxID=71465 RepID=A0A3P7P7G5_CYLGO|nr:unnamed protein product [Cylicostephanus goldi]
MNLERKLRSSVTLVILFFTSSANAQCGYRCVGGGGGGGGGGYATAPVYGHYISQQQPQQPQFLPELQPQPVFTPQPQGYYYTSWFLIGGRKFL